VFWYTVEFGVVREGDAVKAFGAAILSSYGELEHLAKVRGAAGGSTRVQRGVIKLRRACRQRQPSKLPAQPRPCHSVGKRNKLAVL
jgi:phenylalanine-4-hydroxylase